MKFLFPFAVFIAVISGCSFQKDKGGSSASDSITPVINASQASYALASQYVFAKSCVGCHNATTGNGVNLQEYPNVAALIEKIKFQIESGNMPKAPAPPLSQRQKDLFEVWYAAGYPQVAPGEPAPPPAGPVEANFPSIQARVFAVKCATCHNPKGHARGILLDTVEQLACVPPPLVIPGNSGAGDLLKDINPAAPHMPPKMAKIPAVTQQEYEAIKEWVKNGALAGVGEGSAGVSCPAPAPLPDPVPLEPKFAAIKRDIFEMKCTICHGPAGRMPDLPLDTPSDLLSGKKPLVVPGDMTSKLIAVLLPGARHPMPPPDNGIDPLSDQEIAAIKEWIKNGASD